LLLIFGLRQICQAMCRLPVPPGSIWRYPGVPSLVVTYGVSNDLFFSGHTALAVFGAMEVARLGHPVLITLMVAVIVFELIAVLLLRAHYTVDVYPGAVTAAFVAFLLDWVMPALDGWIVVGYQWLAALLAGK